MLAQPLEYRTIGPFVNDLCGRPPGRGWLRRFIKRNSKNIRYCRTMALDPKRAKCFNYPTISGFFEMLKEVLAQHEIPWENVYNMDEKGCQLGGGRKARRKKYLFGRSSKGRYRTQDANLELVTIVETVSADGFLVKPYVIFKGKRVQKSWVMAEGAECTSCVFSWLCNGLRICGNLSKRCHKGILPFPIRDGLTMRTAKNGSIVAFSHRFKRAIHRASPSYLYVMDMGRIVPMSSYFKHSKKMSSYSDSPHIVHTSFSPSTSAY
jgi:hypothetical protein